jgi:hypothetical protein
MPGYSATPLVKKLGIAPAARVLVIEPPDDYRALLAGLPADVHFVNGVGNGPTLVHVFVTRRDDLQARLVALRDGLAPAVPVWVSWPKKASRMPTDVTEDVIRAVALPLGFVDVKVCAVTDVWSGLKLVVRMALR